MFIARFEIQSDAQTFISYPATETFEDAVNVGRSKFLFHADRCIRAFVYDPDQDLTTTVWTPYIDLASIEPGYYGFNGKRYLVEKPDTGRWEGWTFLKTGSDYHNQKTILTIDSAGLFRKSPSREARLIAYAIAADPHSRLREYGMITGCCSKCGRKLENPESRAYGMGPVCRGKS